MRDCPLSCGTCSFECFDKHPEDCPNWAQSGQCNDNPEFMLKECPTSCGLCKNECKDLKLQCAGWAEANGCNDNPEFMVRF